ncbi:MAG: HAD-IA family hydrolase [Planctomycetota bacterium]|nr:MAG: HAD-IA family hydrolase [Planctomycetota bacterium]
MAGQKYIFWDFDGTLAYRPGKWSGALADIANEYKHDANFTYDDFHPLIKKKFFWDKAQCEHHHLSDPDNWWSALSPLFVKAFIEVGFSEHEAQNLAGQVRSRYVDPTHWRLFEDTVEALDILSNLGWKHVILSNHVPELSMIVKKLGLTPHIHAIFNSAETGIEKPNPKAYQNAVVCLAANPDWLLMVGDNVETDVLAPESLGIRSILVRNHDPRVPRCCSTLLTLSELIKKEYK